MTPRGYVEATVISYRTAQPVAAPKRAVRDAVQIAIVAANGVESLVTRNNRHIADTMIWRQIESVCRQADVEFRLQPTDGGHRR